MKVNQEQLLKLVDNLVADLLSMHEDATINLDHWPSAMALVQTRRCAARSDPNKTSGVSHICVLPIGHFHPDRGDKHGTSIKCRPVVKGFKLIHTEWT